MHTPWGQSDHQKQYAPGVVFFGTPSHGGFWLTSDRQQKMPEALRLDSQPGCGGFWYEEDCDWCMVALAFPDLFTPKDYENALNTFINWHPDRYEKHFNVTLASGQSHVRDEETFYRDHANDLITVAAVGDWHANVPKGYVGVTAKKGGSRWWSNSVQNRNRERFFLVPEADYKGRFVIDPEKYREVKTL